MYKCITLYHYIMYTYVQGAENLIESASFTSEIQLVPSHDPSLQRPSSAAPRLLRRKDQNHSRARAAWRLFFFFDNFKVGKSHPKL